MKTATSTMKCPGCTQDNTRTFRKPGFMEKAVVTTKCDGCESDIMFIVECLKGGQAKIQARVTKPSKDLLETLSLLNLQKQMQDIEKAQKNV